ncbi:MAG TPA: CpsD/CapB family tyrosine-protein kinase, partial [Clostridiales bacterium]|nr:CpsD/CapB family tyrosine-protein kinase [Clostridiales bacterium]
VADAEEVINHADATVLVVRQDLAKTIAINDSLDIISQLSTKTIGCVFNDNKNIFGTKASSHHYGYGYGYNYDYGYGYGKRK